MWRLFDWAGLPDYLLTYPKTSTLILNFHRVGLSNNPYYPPINPGVFRGVLKSLQKRCHFTSFKDHAQALLENPEKLSCIVSFDDGYYDFIEFAFPILNELGIPSNLNIIPQCVETGLPPWNIQLYDFLACAPLCKIQMFFSRLSGFEAPSSLRDATKLTRYLKFRPRSERFDILAESESLLREFSQTRMLSRADVLSLAESVEIGCHSFSHESMGYESLDFFKQDFEMCRDYFLDMGLSLSVYAFPNGSYTQEQLNWLLEMDVKQALLVNEDFATGVAGGLDRVTMYGVTVSECRCVATRIPVMARALLAGRVPTA